MDCLIFEMDRQLCENIETLLKDCDFYCPIAVSSLCLLKSNLCYQDYTCPIYWQFLFDTHVFLRPNMCDLCFRSIVRFVSSFDRVHWQQQSDEFEVVRVSDQRNPGFSSSYGSPAGASEQTSFTRFFCTFINVYWRILNIRSFAFMWFW